MDQKRRRLVRLKEVKYQVGMGRTAIYAGMKAGTFPKNYAISARSRAWASDEIDEWVDQRVNGRGAHK